MKYMQMAREWAQWAGVNWEPWQLEVAAEYFRVMDEDRKIDGAG